MTGNLDPENFTLDDLDKAVAATHDLPIPAPPNMGKNLLAQVVDRIITANPDKADEYDHFGGAVAWGIAIGVIAERNRLKRLNR